MLAHTDRLSIGELAARSGLATSALRFYEDEGLIRGERDAAGRRRFPRSALRMVAFIRAGQRVGLSLDEIREALSLLPDGRTPNRADWARLSRAWRARLDRRIRELELVRDQLTSCIGCGCLSLSRCRISNRQDVLASEGAGARRLLDARVSPDRYGSRYGSDGADVFGTGARGCPVCGNPPLSPRATYCSDAHRQLAYRRRQSGLAIR